MKLIFGVFSLTISNNLHSSSKTVVKPKLLNLFNLEEDFKAPRLPLVILLHGYGQNKDLTPNHEIRPVLLQHEKVHVISVDYSTYARKPCYYPWAVVNTRHVAKCLAQFMDQLISLKYCRQNQFHLIGFSLGAQIAGQVSDFAKHKLYHITGLDPARPGYQMHHKLDASDAEFVDVIHTDPVVYSYLSPLGDADFYPNLENFHQTGCSRIAFPSKLHFNLILLILSLLIKLMIKGICNHHRAAAYYAESITSELGFWSYNCGNWSQFLANRCHLHAKLPMMPMGYHLPTKYPLNLFKTAYIKLYSYVILC